MTVNGRHSHILKRTIAELASMAAQATAQAVEEHRRLGYPIGTVRDGAVVWIPAEEIPPYTPPASGEASRG